MKEASQKEIKSKFTIKRLFYGRTLITILALLVQILLILWMMTSLLENVPAMFGGVVAFTAVMLIWVLNSPGNPTQKLSWTILIAIFPVFGTVLYLFFRYDLGQRVERVLLQRSIQESAAFLPESAAEPDAIRDREPELYSVARYLQGQGFPLCGDTEVTYYPVGEEFLAGVLPELEKAERFIFLEYFIVAPGVMWDSILDILKRKAQQGVQVRLLYDGSNAVTLLPYGYPAQMEKLGIQCKMFSPFRPIVSTHYNNRDHRKILVVDGTVAFTGGINIQDRYINRERICGHWKDTAVMVHGQAASMFTLLFLQMWNAQQREQKWEPYIPACTQQTAAGYVIPYADSPSDGEQVGERVYLQILNQAKDYVYIMTPYLILDNEMVTALCFAAQRGVDVRLLLPGIPDKKTVYLLAQGHFPELLRSGVKIYRYSPGFVHAKVFLSDDIHAVVGTINLDYRSLYLHHECAAYLYKVKAIEDIIRDFESTFKLCDQVTMEDIKKRGMLSRLLGAVLKVAAPLM